MATYLRLQTPVILIPNDKTIIWQSKTDFGYGAKNTPCRPLSFGHRDFCMGKSEHYLFFGNYCSLGSQSSLKHLTKWVNEVEWVSKVKVVLWPWSMVTQISKLKLVFLKNSVAIWKQSSYESLRENGNENLYKWVGSHDQHGCHAHIW